MLQAVAAAGLVVCARAECNAKLRPPLLQCARCKAVSYCSKGAGRVGRCSFQRGAWELPVKC